MSYVPIQFQQRLSMVGLFDGYGSEDKSAKTLLMARWPHGFECPGCGGREHCLLVARGLYQCCRCHRQTSLEAGTIFHDSHLSFGGWSLAMHLLSQDKHSLSDLELKRQVGICYNAAWALMDKLLQAVLERESGRVLSGRVEVHDAYVGGGPHEGKRGRGTVGTPLLIAVVQTTKEETPSQAKVVYRKVSALADFKSRSILEWAQRGLGKDNTVLTPGMAAFWAIGAVTKGHDAMVMDQCWPGSTRPMFKWANTILGNLMGNIVGVIHWVSGKQQTWYLCEFQWRFNRLFELSTQFDRLLRATGITPAMPQNRRLAEST